MLDLLVVVVLVVEGLLVVLDLLVVLLVGQDLSAQALLSSLTQSFLTADIDNDRSIRCCPAVCYLLEGQFLSDLVCVPPPQVTEQEPHPVQSGVGATKTGCR